MGEWRRVEGEGGGTNVHERTRERIGRSDGGREGIRRKYKGG